MGEKISKNMPISKSALKTVLLRGYKPTAISISRDSKSFMLLEFADVISEEVNSVESKYKLGKMIGLVVKYDAEVPLNEMNVTYEKKV